MHFRILRMIATSGFDSCTKFVFGRGSVRDHAGGAYRALPWTSSWFKETPSKGKVGEGRERKGEGGNERKWEGTPSSFPAYAPEIRLRSGLTHLVWPHQQDKPTREA